MRFIGWTRPCYFLTAWTFLVLWLMLRMRFGVRLRDWAERLSRWRVVQAVIVMSLFVVVLELTQLPFDIHRHHVEPQLRAVGAALGIVVRGLGQEPPAGHVSSPASWAGFSTPSSAAVRVAGGFTSGWR